MKHIIPINLLLLLTIFLTACGSTEDSAATEEISSGDPKFAISYEGLSFYKQEMPQESYRLEPLKDSDFNALEDSEQLLVADKLLSTLFFGYNLPLLKEKINSGEFLSTVAFGLTQDSTDKELLESSILNEEKFYRPDGHSESIDILSRFYLAEELDSYYLNNWIAYILTQTIMFSPAYELDSSHSPNIARVYNRLVTLLEDDASMRFITYVHMSSDDNWRRFRSPEDNGREMLEIYTLDQNDSHVPIAATALKNWKLDRDNDTLVVGLGENTQALSLFGTTIYNGDDFYRELAKSSSFTYGTVKRLVEFFFLENTPEQIESITQSIVASKPETWQGILKQIIFSKEYLLHTAKAKSAEATLFSLAKKLEFKTRNNSIYYFKIALENMHQASMKYKLGKLNRVPLDTLSFANYTKYIREEVLLRRSNPVYDNNYSNWSRQGWSDSFIAQENYEVDYSDGITSLHNLINYIFETTTARVANEEEMQMFDSLMLQETGGVQEVVSFFDTTDKRLNNDGTQKGISYARNVAYVILDYISRLEDTYIHKKVD
ncbi:MAG: hypothetical protein U9N39_06565 [Campylobacterota bacterium]|nr:hypothetical protein [Campylobacterota bacterium]